MPDEIIDLLMSIAKDQIHRDIACTKDCPCGVNLDQRTAETLKFLHTSKLLNLADDIYSLISESQSNSKKNSHPRKGVARLTGLEFCVLISLAGAAVQIVSAYIIGKWAGKQIAQETIRTWHEKGN